MLYLSQLSLRFVGAELGECVRLANAGRTQDGVQCTDGVILGYLSTSDFFNLSCNATVTLLGGNMLSAAERNAGSAVQDAAAPAVAAVQP